ncbi:DUF2252 family protein [Egicoccus sp. AB-alg2]|uniref:DUF2252 family protein n=1 Tax=Egicoccus sp. AB-alg2 TaxID=3242693 RepID=UPI00359E90F8
MGDFARAGFLDTWYGHLDVGLLLQAKEAAASVLEVVVQRSAYTHHGQRVVQGQLLMQAASDIFLGWSSTVTGRHYYWRQLRDMKAGVDIRFARRYADQNERDLDRHRQAIADGELEARPDL